MTDEQRLQMITEQLILVRDNLFRGMSKSIQKLQARSINELLELPSHTQSPPAQQEPVAYVNDRYSRDGYNDEISVLLPVGTALYTSPPARKPLTDEQINKLRQQYGVTSDGRGIKEFTYVRDFARAIEAAHNIKE